MVDPNRQKGTNRLVISFMAFTFFWLVCGELITLHQKAIYGFDPFSQETPFAKTNNSHSKTKTDTGTKFDKFKDQYHFDCLTYTDSKFNYIYHYVEVEFNNTFTVFNSQSGHPLIALRAPPTF
jgi:hypothetical protein